MIPPSRPNTTQLITTHHIASHTNYSTKSLIETAASAALICIKPLSPSNILQANPAHVSHPCYHPSMPTTYMHTYLCIANKKTMPIRLL